MTRILPHDHDHRFATRSVHAGQVPEPLSGAVMTPIYQTSTYVQEGLGRHKGYEYARTQNPTREALERNIAALEGGSHGFAFGSGLAALDTLLKLLRSGDHVVCGENVYGGTHRLMERVYSELGLKFTFVDMRDVDQVARALTPATRMVYCETPTNPMMNLVDLAALGDLAQARGLLYVVDNTFATPYFQRPRQTFPEISGVAWEHPADRAALQTLRSVPGVDEVIRKTLALLGGERGVRLLFQGNAVRVGPAQFPKLWHLHTEVCTTFDWPTVPELYVSQTPFFNAGAYGIDQPFIVVHSAALELLNDEELRVLMSHELGHVISGHALYRTIAAILALISLGALPTLAGLAVLPIRLAFLEWSRKSELSADRAGLLGAQDIVVAQRLDMKMAGGGRGEGFAAQMNVDAFMQQAHEYAASGEGLDVVYKVLSTLALTHPMHTVRAAELQRWVATGDYDRILRGEYHRRGPETAERPLKDDLAAAGNYYAGEARELATQVADAARRAAERARDAFRNAQKS